MKFIYKHFFVIALVGMTLLSVSVLQGCGDTNSQSATGGGSNFNAGEDIKSSNNTENNSSGDDGGGVDGQGGVDGNGMCLSIPPALPGCSHQSWLDCVCYDPNNPDQN